MEQTSTKLVKITDYQTWQSWNPDFSLFKTIIPFWRFLTRTSSLFITFPSQTLLFRGLCLEDQQRSLNKVTKRVENCWYYYKLNAITDFTSIFHDSMIFQILFLVSRPNPHPILGPPVRVPTPPQNAAAAPAPQPRPPQLRGAAARRAAKGDRDRGPGPSAEELRRWFPKVSPVGVGAQGLDMVQ